MSYGIVSFDGSQPVTVDASTTATRSSVIATTVDQVLIAANTDRKGLLVYNNSNAPLRIGLGSTVVSLTDFSVYVPSQGNWFLPYHFTGELHGIWEAATGNAIITELTT